MSVSMFVCLRLCVCVHAYTCICVGLNPNETGRGVSLLSLLYSLWCGLVIIQYVVIVEDAA